MPRSEHPIIDVSGVSENLQRQFKPASKVQAGAVRMEVDSKKRTADLMIYEGIGENWYGTGMTAKKFAEQLNSLDVDEINVRINSGGGSVFDGIAIYNLLAAHPAKVTVHIDGLAASIASVIAMAGDEIIIADGAAIMIHDSLGGAMGNADLMRQLADELEKIDGAIASIYAKRSGRKAETFRNLMDEESWFYGKEAVSAGLADKVGTQKRIAAKFDPSDFKKAPAAHLAQPEEGDTSAPPQPPGQKEPHMADQPKAATLAELKKAFPAATAEFREECQEKNMTLEQAKDHWIDTLQARNEGLEADLEKANKAGPDEEEEENQEDKTAAGAKAKSTHGTQPLRLAKGGAGSGATTEEDPIAKWNELLQKKLEAKVQRAKAVAEMSREHPELREAMVIAYNEIHRPGGKRKTA